MYGVRTMSITSGLELCGYVDCDLDYLMPTYDQVDSFVSRLDKPSECVFLITHIGGWVNPDIEMIAELCREKNIALIEDCAHSLGSTLKAGTQAYSVTQVFIPFTLQSYSRRRGRNYRNDK